MTESQKIVKLKRQINDFISFSIDPYKLTQYPHGEMADDNDDLLYDWDMEDNTIVWWDPFNDEPMLFLTQDFEFYIDEIIWKDLKKMFGLRFRKNIKGSFENWFRERYHLKCNAGMYEN